MALNKKSKVLKIQVQVRTSVNADYQNARTEHDKALQRVMMALLQDGTELFKQFSDNESFRCWLADTVFTLTYE